jgi:hypothetical protein
MKGASVIFFRLVVGVLWLLFGSLIVLGWFFGVHLAAGYGHLDVLTPQYILTGVVLTLIFIVVPIAVIVRALRASLRDTQADNSKSHEPPNTPHKGTPAIP